MNQHGRPPSKYPRTERKQLLLSVDELAAQIEAAKAEGMDWSNWVRRAAAIAVVVEGNMRAHRARRNEHIAKIITPAAKAKAERMARRTNANWLVRELLAGWDGDGDA